MLPKGSVLFRYKAGGWLIGVCLRRASRIYVSRDARIRYFLLGFGADGVVFAKGQEVRSLAPELGVQHAIKPNKNKKHIKTKQVTVVSWGEYTPTSWSASLNVLSQTVADVCGVSLHQCLWAVRYSHMFVKVWGFLLVESSAALADSLRRSCTAVFTISTYAPNAASADAQIVIAPSSSSASIFRMLAASVIALGGCSLMAGSPRVVSRFANLSNSVTIESAVAIGANR